MRGIRLQMLARRWARVRSSVLERGRSAFQHRKSKIARGGYMEPTRWKCRYCGHAQVVTEETASRTDVPLRIALSRHGKIGARIILIVCSNPDCKEITLDFSLRETAMDSNFERYLTDNVHHSWPLLPESSAKPQPEYIPKPIVENYNQACRIRDLSPNASAAKSRRCLQGMIRDFCEISKYTLAQEIDSLRNQVDIGEGPKGVNHRQHGMPLTMSDA